MKRIILFFIHVYQKTLSFDHSWLRRFKPYPQCKFYPSCSQYACGAIEDYGVLKGAFISAKRILRCHPWANGGIDFVPQKKNSRDIL